jgi:hypothetical protein
LAPFSDYSNTDTIGTGVEEYEASNSHESVESNFVQSVVSGFETGNDEPTELSQGYWSLLPSNGSLETDVSSEQPTETVPANALSRTTNYEEVSVAETTGFDAQITRYATEMSEDIHTTVRSMLGDEEPRSSEHGDTTTEEETTRTTITESSVTEFTTQRQDQSSSTDSGVKSFGDNGTSDINVIGDHVNTSSNDSSSKLRPIQSRVGFDGPLMIVLTDRGIVEARPSVVRAETEILVRGDKVRHRNVEVPNRDFTPSNSVTQTAYNKNELSGNFETWTTGVVAETLSHTDITTEAYPAVMFSETGPEGTGTSFVDDVVTTSLQPVPEHTVIPATGTTVNSESGESSLKLYGDTKLLLDFHQNSVPDANELPGSQAKTSNSVQASELDNSLLYTATETLISTVQDSAVSKSDNIEHNESESMSTDDRHVSGKEPSIVTESNTQYFLAQALYKGADGTGLQLTSSKLNSTDTQSQPEKSESEISENNLELSEITNEIPITIQTELSVHETVTPSGKSDVTETGRIAQTVSEPSVRESGGVSVVRKEESSGDCDENVISTATEAERVGSEPTRSAECITEHFQNSEPYETAVSLRPSAEEAESVSMQTERFSASEAFTEHSNARGTEQLTEITTLPSDVEITASAKQTKINKTEESVSSSSAEPTAGYQLRSGVHSETQKDSAFLNKSTDPIPPSTVIHTEFAVTSDGTTVLPVVFDTVENSSPPSAAETSNPSSTMLAVAAPSTGATTKKTNEHSPLCGVATAGTSPGTQCWLVQFMNANSSVPVCVGSYLDTSTIVTSAKCISRSEEFIISVDS